MRCASARDMVGKTSPTRHHPRDDKMCEIQCVWHTRAHAHTHTQLVRRAGGSMHEQMCANSRAATKHRHQQLYLQRACVRVCSLRHKDASSQLLNPNATQRGSVFLYACVSGQESMPGTTSLLSEQAEVSRVPGRPLGRERLTQTIQRMHNGRRRHPPYFLSRPRSEEHRLTNGRPCTQR